MVREMLTGNNAAAWGARLAEVDYVPAFPITPQAKRKNIFGFSTRQHARSCPVPEKNAGGAVFPVYNR